MKLPRRRAVFQLTPLLDLLLIVIFAQFLGVQVATSESELELAQAKDEFNREMTTERQRLQRDAAALEVERQRQARAIDSVLEREARAGDQLIQILKLGSKAAESLLDNAASGVDASELLRVNRDEIVNLKGREFVDFLVRYSEMTKRCDLWEIYVSEEGTIEFDNGRTVRRASAKTPDEVADVVFEAYKTFPEPKTLVIILFSFGDILEPTYDTMKQGLPIALQRMRDDAGGRRWFELAELGYLSKGPSLRKSP